MLTISKSHSLLAAEAVVAIFTILNNDGSDIEEDVDIEIQAATVGQRSALMLVDETAGKVAWILLNRSSEGIRLLFGEREKRSYDFENHHIPNDFTEECDLRDNSYYEAAQRLYTFFTIAKD